MAKKEINIKHKKIKQNIIQEAYFIVCDYSLYNLFSGDYTLLCQGIN